MPDNKPTTIVVSKPFGGWIQTFSGLAASSPAAALEAVGENASSQYTYSEAISLFRLEKFGHIAPGHVFTAITDASSRITELAINGSNAVHSTLEKPFVVLTNGRVVRLDSSGASTEAHYDPVLGAPNHSGHTIASSNNVDLITMKDQAATPVTWVVWSWEDGTDSDIGIIQADLSTGADPDWFSAVINSNTELLKSVPHKLALGPDGNLYVTDGSYIRQVNITGALGSATLGEVLPLGPSWTANGICNYKNYVAIIGHQSVIGFTGITRSVCRVWLWDGYSDGYNFSFDIPDNYANAIYSDGQQLLAFTEGRHNSSKLWRFNGSEFVKEFDGDAVSNTGTPIQGALEDYQNSILIGSGKHIYRWFSGGFHDEAIVSDGTNEATSVGMVKNLFQARIWVGVSYGGPTYKIYYLSSFLQYYTPANFRTQLYDMGFAGTITGIRVYFSQFGTGASVVFSLFKNYDSFGVGGANDVLNKTVDFSTYGTLTEFDLMDANMPAVTDVSSFYMNFQFNHASVSNTAAIIRKVEIDWVPSK